MFLLSFCVVLGLHVSVVGSIYQPLPPTVRHSFHTTYCRSLLSIIILCVLYTTQHNTKHTSKTPHEAASVQFPMLPITGGAGTTGAAVPDCTVAAAAGGVK